jgi:putative addiction module component (TIGR02574 family)
MMTREQILSEAMSLDPKDREILAEQLWHSIDGTTGEEVAQAWADEIRRRVAVADAHPEDSVPAEDVIERLRAKLKR